MITVKEKDEITVILSEEQKRKPLGEFYRTVAEKACYTENENTIYDCRKILVSSDIQDAIIETYKELCPGAPIEAISMLLVTSGPKVDCMLGKGEVVIQRGFVTCKEGAVGWI